MHYADIRILNRIATRAVNSGMIIVGGGLIKHHICNANLMVSRRGGGGVGRRQSEEVESLNAQPPACMCYVGVVFVNCVWISA